jgi:hypothetical protein
MARKRQRQNPCGFGGGPSFGLLLSLAVNLKLRCNSYSALPKPRVFVPYSVKVLKTRGVLGRSADARLWMPAGLFCDPQPCGRFSAISTLLHLIVARYIPCDQA